MAGRSGAPRNVAVIATLLGGFSLALSACAAVVFRVLVFLPSESLADVVYRSLGLASLLALGGIVATAVSTLAHNRMGRAQSTYRLASHRNLIAATIGPVAAVPLGLVFLVGTMGWYGLALLVAISVAAIIGYWVVLRIVRAGTSVGI
jgi:hypothetical protein